MRLPRIRFTVRRLMVAVAIVALISLVASNPERHDGITDKRVVTPVASVVAAAYGFGAMRRPLVFLLPLLAILSVTSQVDHPTPDVINISAAGCFLGWLIGAPVGWISRRLTRAGYPFSASIEPPEPDPSKHSPANPAWTK